MLRVLFVDDEPHVLEGLRRLLRSTPDLEAVMVGCADEALAALAGGRFDVIVSDLRMPGIDGAELLRRVETQHPSLRRILLSGTSGQPGDTTAHAVLRKPCARDELLAAIRPA